mgnify:FL=1
MCKLTFIKTNLRAYTFEVKKIKEWVEDRSKGGRVLNLFCGKTKLNVNEFRVDIDKKEALADIYMDVYDFVKNCKDRYDTIILDPPYSIRKSMEYYKGNYTSKFKLIADECARLSDRVISFGYHSTFLGEKRGYQLEELCVFGHSGSQHCTIAIIEKKVT